MKKLIDHKDCVNFFEKNNWVKIENFIDSNLAFLFYNHIKIKAERLTYLNENFKDEDNHSKIFKDLYGTFEDTQAFGDFSHYGDSIYDTLLVLSLNNISALTNKKLIPMYTYHRLYTTGTELKKHIDRKSCEISVTMCLGYDLTNVDLQKYPDYNWPMLVEVKNKKIPICLKPGDRIIYRGNKIKHWREPFLGKNQAQLFLHYVEYDKNTHKKLLYDGRPFLGLPPGFIPEGFIS